jgi:L-ascorbate 6-phosphate lactonase
MKPESSNPMDLILQTPLQRRQAGLWFLGQAGYLVRAAGRTLVLDPYLSDAAGRSDPRFSRLYPPPIQPRELKADIFVVTHDHLDHLDPETIRAYRFKSTTDFVAPRLASVKLAQLGVPAKRIRRLDAGETRLIQGVKITGVYAVPSAPEVIDTTGYGIEFANGRSLYATADTGYAELLLECVPQAEVLLVCINGKWGNLNPEQAARLAAKVAPRFALPNHYDLMALNAENPKTFEFLLQQRNPGIATQILRVLEPFVWL